MTIELNHVLVPSHDKQASARFFADTLGLENLGLGSTSGAPAFARAKVGDTTLDFTDGITQVIPLHFAFAVSDDDFDTILGRVKTAGLPFYADAGHDIKGELNNWNGGRGFYFSDPNDGHSLEVLTRPA